MQGSYVEFSFIEKLHARITEVSPANPGETLNDAVERLIAELEAAEADARECRAERARYGDAMTERLAGVEAERDALRSEVATYRKTLDEVSEIATNAVDERDALRAALQSLVDGKSEFDIEYDTGMPADEARRIMDLAYNRK